MFPPVQLPIDDHAVTFTDASDFFLWAPSLLCRDISSFSCVFCWSFFLSQWQLQCHLTSHNVNLTWLFFFHEKWTVKLLSMWQWLMIGINSRKIWKRHPRVFPVSNVAFSLLFVNDCRIGLWYQSVQSSFLFSQCHEGPEHWLGCGRGACWCFGTTSLPHNIALNKNTHIASCHFVQLSLPGVCVCACVC